jgi:hypothetical protein
MNANKTIVIINGSPKINEPSASEAFADIAARHFEAKGHKALRIHAGKSLRQKHTAEDFETMRQSDALVFIFPLYVFCLPGLLIRYLQDYAQYLKEHPGTKAQKVYALVNCGFPEPGINDEAVRVIESFSRAIGGSFGFGIMFGEGGMIVGALHAPFMKKVLGALGGQFDQMAEDCSDDAAHPRPTVALRPSVGSRLYLFMGNMGWKQGIRKAGLKRRQLYATPYME